VRLIAQIKLQPTEQQADGLKRTMEAANSAANFLSTLAWDTRQFRQYDLHHAAYYAIRAQFGLPSEVTIRVISKVADAYKPDKQCKRTFRLLGSIAFNFHSLRIIPAKKSVSILTLDGRQQMAFVCGERQAVMLQGQRGESDLVYRDGEFYLLATCDVDEAPISDVDGFLGVDLGIANIAVDSDHTVYQGKTVKSVRYRHRRLRQKLQSKGTKSTRRRLKGLSGKERRFATWTNHNISKSIVAKAKGTDRGIAIEELGGIRDRVMVRRSQRATLHSWSFAQLRAFLEYKAKLAGVPLVAVDPRNTSRLCPSCGHIDKANRKTQSQFLCVNCGHAGLADHIAAINIGGRAVVNRPNVSTAPRINVSTVQRQGQTPCL
jgi:IS605 OrfB family transposase